MRKLVLMLLVLLGGCMSSLLVAQTLPSYQAQEELLKSEGLTKKGGMYLLDMDLKLEDELRPVRKAQAQFQIARRIRQEIELDIKRTESSIAQWTKEHEDLQQQLAQAKDVRKYNEIVGNLNALGNRVKDAMGIRKQREQELQKLGTTPDDYMTLVIALAQKMETTAKKYEALAADPRIKEALASINAGPRKVKLGPSATFLEEMPRWIKQRASIDSAVIKLDIEHGVPQVEVAINGKHKQMMVVDSGASVVLLTAEVAQQIGLTASPNDTILKMIVANGDKVDARLTHLDSIRLAQFTAENVECVVLPSSVKGAACLLGGTFLRHFVYKMDLASGTLQMSQVRDPQPDTKKIFGTSTGAKTTVKP